MSIMSHHYRKRDAFQSRRNVVKQLAKGGVVVSTVFNLPEEWVKPLVDVVLLPAHADCTPPSLCSYELSIINLGIPAGVPQTCSGNLIPPLDITGEFSLVGCERANIVNIQTALPGSANLVSSFAIGDTVSHGATFVLTANDYPSSSPFACMPTEPGSITIEYNCADFSSPPQSLSIDMLGVILSASN